MKKIVLFLALIGIGTSASATFDYESAQSYCKTAETIAGFAQGSRQLGKSASETIDKLMASASKLKNPEARLWNEKQIFFIVEHAYKVPVHPTQDLKIQAVFDFAQNNYLACIQPFQKSINEQ